MRMDADPDGVAPGGELLKYFGRLLKQFGPQHWWPARTRLEVILGAILTQNTSWNNVSLALASLRRRGLLVQGRLMSAQLPRIEAAIRPAGSFRQKARTIRCFLEWLDRRYSGSLDRALGRPPFELRQELLGLRGIGPETADAILLYAAGRPFFVADAYTRRVLARHGWVADGAGYEETQQFLHRHLRLDAALFNEFHALLVETAKRYCHRAAPRCQGCPLEFDLPASGARRPAPPRVRRTASGIPAESQA